MITKEKLNGHKKTTSLIIWSPQYTIDEIYSHLDHYQQALLERRQIPCTITQEVFPRNLFRKFQKYSNKSHQEW